MLIDNLDISGGFPEQKISWRKKTQKWAARCVQYGADQNLFTSSAVVNSYRHNKINYDLVNGILHMDDLQLFINPTNLNAPNVIPEQIPHYPIMNSKLNVLQGEAGARVFDWHAVITNPNALSEVEKAKHDEMVARTKELLESHAQNEEEFHQAMQEAYDDLKYNYQDAREVWANQVLSHYSRENNFKNMFRLGFNDAEIVGQEAYQMYIRRGEPCMRQLNPQIMRIYRNGYSNKIEDADMIVLEEYWSKGKVIDIYGDQLTSAEIDYIEKYDFNEDLKKDSLFRIGGKPNYVEQPTVIGQDDSAKSESNPFGLVDEPVKEIHAADFIDTSEMDSLGAYDAYNNIRVCQVFWKSLRQIKKVKSYNPITGEPVYTLHTEDYIINKEMGEEEEKMWVNQAWQGTRIGSKLFVDMRPCPVQYNSIDDPSKCHFGIIGTIYNVGLDKPFSLVDMMKPYAYLYDACFDRLNRLIARNHGKAIRLDLAKIPSSWGMDKWMQILTQAGIAVEDSFEEGKSGAAKGKLAGAMNNASNGVIDMDLGNSIANYLQILTSIEAFMGKVVGITDQREGQIQNRETVGGVERSVLQSSHITEWLFYLHDDTKRRALEAFLDLCRACFRGRNKKFQYISSSDMAQKIVDVDGDFFSSASYGLIVDNEEGSQDFKSNLPMIIQAAIQNGSVGISKLVQLYNATSRAEKQKILEDGEVEMREQQQQQQQQQLEAQQQIAKMNQQTQMAQMEHEAAMNTENNETKILIEEMKSRNVGAEGAELSAAERANLDEKIREFDENMRLNRDKLQFDKEKAKKEAELKLKQINKPKTSSNK